jgi:ribulose kinase
VLAVDADGRPLRPAILWMDVRASEQAERVSAADHAVLKYSGHADVSAEFGLPKALWLRDHEPDTYEAADPSSTRRLGHPAPDRRAHAVDQHGFVQVLLRS